MPQLHLIQAAISYQAFEQRYKLCVEIDDAIMFLNDSLFSLTINDFRSKAFATLVEQTKILCIGEQVQSRAIARLIPAQIEQVGYRAFVDATRDSSKIISW